MGLFKSIKKLVKKAAPTVGAVVGFSFGGPMGAAIGSGIGSLATGRSVEDSLKNAAIAGIGGIAAKGLGFEQGVSGQGFFARALPGYKGVTSLGFGAPKAAFQGLTAVDKKLMSQLAGNEDKFGEMFAQSQRDSLGKTIQDQVASAAGNKGMFGGVMDVLGSDAFKYGALGLGAGALLGGAMNQQEEQVAATGDMRADDPNIVGEGFGTVVGPFSDNVYDLTDAQDRRQYNQELLRYQDSGFQYDIPVTSGYAHGGDVHAGGGEVNGPGTGVSDSVPARLSDGEFVLTAKAVRGAGGGDRDVGAARLYDMMSELEATA